MKTLHTDRGFSVVELMVTIAVLAIIVGIGLPSFQSMLQNSRLDSAAESMADSFRFARSEAIARNASVTADGSYANGWEVKVVGGETLRVYKPFHSQVTLDKGTALIFNPRGMANTSETFTLSYGGTRCIRVLLSGNVKLYKDSCPN